MKRAVIVASDKGGVGKSFFSVNFVQYLKDTERVFRAFDPDFTNSTLTRFQPDTTFVDITKKKSIDQIALAFDEVPLVAVDGIAGHKGMFLRWIEDVNLFEIASEIDLAITFVLVVDEDKDTVFQTSETLRAVGDKADWLIVKNHKVIGHTDMWDNSQAREFADSLDAREIVFDKFDEHLISKMQRANLTFASAADNSEHFDWLDRQRCLRYKRQINAMFDENRDILLDTEQAQKAAVPAKGKK
jgi:hypothetical protein